MEPTDELNEKIRRAEQALRSSIQKYAALQNQAQALQQAQKVAEHEIIATQAMLAGLKLANNQDPGPDSLPAHILQMMRQPTPAGPATPPNPFEESPTP